ncbi:MAG: hypothetical protein HYZ00_05215 [Candidatus Hydrogenedentes bacterium]|nr:hypothetical protein [Candidatus Hydrogenedentota bacterium]
MRVLEWLGSRGRALGVLALLPVLSAGCMTAKEEGEAPSAKESPIKFAHALHLEQGLDCATCHAPNEEQAGHFALPGHDVCSVCHEIGEDQADPATCKFCHVGEELTIERVSVLHPDLKFSHDPHTAAGVECAKCHEDVDKKPLPKAPLKPFCMNCHGKTDPALNECSVCHQAINQTTLPKFRGETRIPHDAPEIWEHVHGRESTVDPVFCALCHTDQDTCQECHSRTAPKDHTIVWRRGTHGLHATWERNRCDACHEEDSCLKCHKNTTPTSHRGGWGRPINRHCFSCHFPEDENKCTVCHETIEHPTALPSPHNFGIFPANCALCHPGGMPFRAPHPVNSTVGCVVCHK